MGIAVGPTIITFNDGTTQSTAAVAIPTAAYAVGTYIIGRPFDLTNYTVGSTVSGGNMYALSPGAYVDDNGYGSPYWSDGAYNRTLVGAGSWRCVSPAGQIYQYYNANQTYPSRRYAGLWVRYA